eukprot:4123129-Amphidinium_carterae.1
MPLRFMSAHCFAIWFVMLPVARVQEQLVELPDLALLEALGGLLSIAFLVGCAVTAFCVFAGGSTLQRSQVRKSWPPIKHHN